MNRSLIVILLLSFPVFSVSAVEPERIPLQVRENIRAVYQVSDDQLHEGVNRGLFYARKIIGSYGKHGIAAGQVNLHLVYHGSGIAALLNSDARKRLGSEKIENPNAEILAELLKSGVQVEICEDTMLQKGVTADDLMSGVKIVVGAFPRLIDLQLQGYAYIKFE